MNFKTGFIAFAFMCVGAASLAGCGNACEDFADAYIAKLEECGIDVPADGGSDGSGECTDEAAALAECLTPCVSAAACGALDGTDLDAALEYAECAGACLE